MAAEALPWFEKEAKKTQGARTDICKNIYKSHGRSTELAGKMVGVSHTYAHEIKIRAMAKLGGYLKVNSRSTQAQIRYRS